jgi:hypothetical protein
METYKRRNFVVNRRLQFGMISFFLITVLIALIISTAGLIVYYSVRFPAEAGGTPATEAESVPREAGRIPAVPRLELILPPILINNLCIMVIMAVFGIFFSHRIAGPLYHIETVVAEVLAGNDAERVHLRPRDFVHDLANEINALIEDYTRVKK